MRFYHNLLIFYYRINFSEQKHQHFKFQNQLNYHYVKSLIKLLVKAEMQQLGANFRRKSYENVQPILPRKVYTREEGTRTVHKQVPCPTQSLKIFRRRLLFQSMPSLDSLPDIHKNTGRSSMSRTQQNNNPSETGSRKNNPTLMTMVSQTDWKTQKAPNLPEIIPNKQQQPVQTQKLNIEQDNQNMDGQDQVQKIEADQGYTMGNQVNLQQQQQQNNKYIPKFKSFSTGGNYLHQNVTHNYEIINEAQARMQQRFIKSKFQHYRSKKQNDEIIQMINKYKLNKKNLQKQNRRKAQTLKALANIRRAVSLPRLSHPHINNDHTKRIVVPTYQQMINPDGNPEQNKRKILGKRLQESLSFGRLQMVNTSHKNKNVNYQGYLQEQIGYALQTERILREKGITLDSSTIKSSLINIRQIPIQISQKIPFPTAKLISNPLMPKQKPKKKKK